MAGLSLFKHGLPVSVSTPRLESQQTETLITEEAGIAARPADDLRVTLLVLEGDTVSQGSPILCSRHYPQICVTAPMPGRVASVELGTGHRLSLIRIFHEEQAGRQEFDTKPAGSAGHSSALPELMQASGLWRSFRSRPFGQVPKPEETPAAIFVMALDTRPNAIDPMAAIQGREDALERGMRAIAQLTDGPVFLCQARGAGLSRFKWDEKVRVVSSPKIHPWGLAGFQIHRYFPATTERPVWDIRIENVVALGSLLETGLLPETRLVSVAGPAMRGARLYNCQPGADLRRLCRGLVKPGPHRIISGSALDGREARWLSAGDRQVTVLEDRVERRQPHWFASALNSASRPLPLIPTAALDQALGGELPAAALLRALSAGDSETFRRLGGLSLIEEDLSLVDYVTRAAPGMRSFIHGMLRRIADEEAA